MSKYIPPFTITNIMLDRISSIMKKIGKLDNYKDLNKMPILRRNNRIKSIHSSILVGSWVSKLPLRNVSISKLTLFHKSDRKPFKFCSIVKTFI